jgi:hypothetical protein
LKIEKTFQNWFDVYSRNILTKGKSFMNTTIEKEKNTVSIASIFSEMTDQRKPRGVRYLFESLLILLSLAKLCNQDTPSEIADWVKNRSELLKKKLKLDWKQMPSQSTWQRLIGANIDAAEFDRKVGEYFGALSPEERELLNLDGKSSARRLIKKLTNNCICWLYRSRKRIWWLSKSRSKRAKMRSAELKDYYGRHILKIRLCREMRYLPKKNYRK